MAIRTLFASLSLLVIGTFSMIGCAVSDESADTDPTASSEDGLRVRICPMVYDPVCGKDGKTYSNTCMAGGPQRVAYKGECIDPCAAVLCIVGTVCEANGKNVRCVPTGVDPCATVRCAQGTYCDASTGTAQCVPDSTDPCATVRCAEGYHCEAQQVQCITTPCDPVAACVPN